MGKKTAEQISFNMRKVKNRDSVIEILLRRELWRRGIRYRKNAVNIFGKPDIAFLGKKIAIFCDSEFWHGYNWEINKDKIKTRQDFWLPKIQRNMERDRIVTKTLESQGWTVIRFWGEEINKDVSRCADRIEAIVKAQEVKHGQL